MEQKPKHKPLRIGLALVWTTMVLAILSTFLAFAIAAMQGTRYDYFGAFALGALLLLLCFAMAILGLIGKLLCLTAPTGKGLIAASLFFDVVAVGFEVIAPEALGPSILISVSLLTIFLQRLGHQFGVEGVERKAKVPRVLYGVGLGIALLIFVVWTGSTRWVAMAGVAVGAFVLSYPSLKALFAQVRKAVASA